MPFEPGARVGPYEIIAPVGAGGMGEIYRARDTRLDRTVAVKVLAGGLTADAESRQRFEQEARAIAALNDPHICTIHDVGRHGDLDYLVLEYLEGETLAGRKAFEGGSMVTVVAAIMSNEPPPIPAVQSAHPLLDHVMRRCLEKNRDRRWQNMGDVTGELRWIAAQPAAAPAAVAAP